MGDAAEVSRWANARAHAEYVRLYDELPEDLEAICPPCHDWYTKKTRQARQRRYRRKVWRAFAS